MWYYCYWPNGKSWWQEEPGSTVQNSTCWAMSVCTGVGETIRSHIIACIIHNYIFFDSYWIVMNLVFINNSNITLFLFINRPFLPPHCIIKLGTEPWGLSEGFQSTHWLYNICFILIVYLYPTNKKRGFIPMWRASFVKTGQEGGGRLICGSLC